MRSMIMASKFSRRAISRPVAAVLGKLDAVAALGQAFDEISRRLTVILDY